MLTEEMLRRRVRHDKNRNRMGELLVVIETVCVTGYSFRYDLMLDMWLHHAQDSLSAIKERLPITKRTVRDSSNIIQDGKVVQ